VSPLPEDPTDLSSLLLTGSHGRQVRVYPSPVLPNHVGNLRRLTAVLLGVPAPGRFQAWETYAVPSVTLGRLYGRHTVSATHTPLILPTGMTDGSALTGVTEQLAHWPLRNITQNLLGG
jgi:hypothetical protein